MKRSSRSRDNRDPRRPRSSRRRAGGHGRHQRGDPAAEIARRPERPERPSDEALADNGFAALRLPDALLCGVVAAGFENPTPIQVEAIPPALEGRDLFGQAQTGTGKTAAFMLPSLARIEMGGGSQVLVVAPTRELALQTEVETLRLGVFTDVHTACLVGGRSYGPQRDALSAGAEVVVGTPGRTLDMARSGAFDARRVDILVLDEGDRFYDLGFKDELERILKITRNRRQTLLFSATIPPPVERMAGRHLTDPVKINVMPRTATVDTVEQCQFVVEDSMKFQLLMRILEEEDIEQGIVFTRTKRKCSSIGERIARKGRDAMVFHGDLVQRKREKILKRFREGKFHVLVATDAAARGLDIPAVSHIINYDIPEYAEDYVHRVGRTARMGREGRAITFVTPEDGDFLTEIEKLINIQIHNREMPGLNLLPSAQVKKSETPSERAARRPPVTVRRRLNRKRRR